MAKKHKTFKTPMMDECMSAFFGMDNCVYIPIKEEGLDAATEKALNEIETINAKIESLMDNFEDSEGPTVDDITIDWFISNPCDTQELLVKEYIKWYFEMGDLWIDDVKRIARNLTWGRKFVKEFEEFFK